MAEYKLTYWDFRATQGEPIRFIFAYAGVPYEDIRISPGDTYPLLPMDIKNKLPYGHVPVLEFNGKQIAQSPAIGKYLAKKFGLAGADDFESAKCDEIVDALLDFQKARFVTLAVVETNPELKSQKEKFHKEHTIPKYMGQFNKIVKENGGKFLVGKGYTWADLHMASFVNQLEEKDPGMLKGYPELQNAAKNILNLPNIKKFVDARPKDNPPALFTQNGLFVA